MENQNIGSEEQTSDIDPLVKGLFGEESAEAEAGNQSEEKLDFSGIDEELIRKHPYYRGLQSKYDQTANELQKHQQASNLWEQFDKDQELRNAIVSKYYPEVFKPQNSQQFIRETLAKEFGETFEDTLENGSTFQKLEIQERWRELKDQAKKSYQPPKSYEDVIADRRKKALDAQKAFEAELNDVITTFKFDEATTQEFQGWAGKVRLKDLGYMFSRAKNAKKNSGPQNFSFTSTPSFGAPNQNKEQKEMETAFGKPPERLF